MNCFRSLQRAFLLALFGAVTFTATLAGAATKAPPPPSVSDLQGAGFKVLVASNKVQEDWVRTLPVGRIRPMQRNGKKYFIYPDAPNKQIYVGGPQEYETYWKAHPEVAQTNKDAAGYAYRAKQADAMREASARDLSNPFLGVTWADLGYY